MRSLKRLMKSDREVREICKRETDAYLGRTTSRSPNRRLTRPLRWHSLSCTGTLGSAAGG